MWQHITTAKYDVILNFSDLLDLENYGSLILVAQPIKLKL